MTPGQHFDGGSVFRSERGCRVQIESYVELTTLAGDTVEKGRNGRGSDCSLNEGEGSGMPVCLARGVCSDSFGPPFVTLCYAALLSDKNDGRPTADGRMAE